MEILFRRCCHVKSLTDIRYMYMIRMPMYSGRMPSLTHTLPCICDEYYNITIALLSLLYDITFVVVILLMCVWEWFTHGIHQHNLLKVIAPIFILLIVNGIFWKLGNNVMFFCYFLQWNTGGWSSKAAKEAAKYGKVNLVLPKTSKYTNVPDKSTWTLNPNASYAYYCDNETADGVEFPFVPETGDVPLVVDMSSNIFTRPIDVTKVDMHSAQEQH